MAGNGDLMNVNLSFNETIEEIKSKVLSEGMSNKLIDEYGDKESFHLLVFEKYFMRASSRASLTVHISTDNTSTKVYAIGSGGGQGAIFSFDWGAADKFTGTVRKILRNHII